MIRHMTAVVAVLCLSPSWLNAQDAVFTVKAPSATVHLAPSTGSPVIGRAPRGTLLEVTNELGSWVKVSWPDARDGEGFVHLSLGSVARQPPATSAAGTAPAPARRPSGAAPLSTIEEQAVPVQTTRSVGSVIPPVHLFGIGGTMGGTTLGLGGTARIWSRNGLGLELEVSRHGFTSTSAPGRVTSIRFAPSVLYSLPDHVSDYVRLRPYAGAGTSIHRQSLSDPSMGGAVVSDSGLGFRAFAGTEVTLATAPRLALSVGAGYERSPSPFAGFQSRRLSVAVSGHWYVR
jgi:hypothetical protein